MINLIIYKNGIKVKGNHEDSTPILCQVHGATHSIATWWHVILRASLLWWKNHEPIFHGSVKENWETGTLTATESLRSIWV